MRIAQVAPPFESVPPAGYGGTERIVATLCDELVRRGHDVTLLAAGDSRTSARLAEAEQRFSPGAMTAAYEQHYADLVARTRPVSIPSVVQPCEVPRLEEDRDRQLSGSRAR